MPSYAHLLAYPTGLRPLTLEFNNKWSLAPILFTAKCTKLSHAVVKIAYFAAFAQRGYNKLVCNKLAMLKIPDDVSEPLFNVLDKVYTSFGASEKPLPDGELTDQNL